jgi:hypothetical protein
VDIRASLADRADNDEKKISRAERNVYCGCPGPPRGSGIFLRERERKNCEKFLLTAVGKSGEWWVHVAD